MLPFSDVSGLLRMCAVVGLTIECKMSNGWTGDKVELVGKNSRKSVKLGDWNLDDFDFILL